MPTLARPELDVLEGLTTAIIVDQERMSANVRSTVGTATDSGAMLRIFFSRLGQPHIGSPNAFSFDVPSVRASGAITIERGAGKTVKRAPLPPAVCVHAPKARARSRTSDLSQLYDDSKSLNEGALTIPGYNAGDWNFRLYSAHRFFDPDKPIRKYTEKELHHFLHREPTRMRNVEPAVAFTACPECGGTRAAGQGVNQSIRSISAAMLCAKASGRDRNGWCPASNSTSRTFCLTR